MSRSHIETSALDLLEEGVHLLRRAPGALALYYVGSIPFVLGLLFFWADMSRSAYAAARSVPASFALALGYLWMKSWQAAFGRGLWQTLSGQPEAGWNFSRLARLALTQAVFQPWGLVLFLPALLLTVPFPWTFAYFQNVTIFGLDERKGMREVGRRAWAQATLWPGQNSMLLFWLALFSALVFLNLALLLLGVPWLLKSLLGIETRFVQSYGAFLNTTFLATACALVYLCVDPLVKAVYALRCFEGESLKTGESIWAKLARLQKSAGALLLALALLFGAPAALHAQAGGQTRTALPSPRHETTAAPTALAGALERSIGETLRNPRYAWRMPRQLKQRISDEHKSFLELFMDSIGRMIGRGMDAVSRWFTDLSAWLDKWMKAKDHTKEDPATFLDSLASVTHFLIWALISVVLVTLAIFLVRLWQQRDRLRGVRQATPIAVPLAPDLADEGTSADQLPTDAWLTLAQQMIECGDLRLALRALYLASLAALGQAGLIRIRRSKSNRDYLFELLRRAHAWPGLLELMNANVASYDRSWYGLHEVTREGLEEFKTNYERIRSLVG